jgi:hypothetical protein
MAEIQSNGGGGDGGKKRAKKQSTKVDMTPFGGFGFLATYVLRTYLNFLSTQSVENDLP